MHHLVFLWNNFPLWFAIIHGIISVISKKKHFSVPPFSSHDCAVSTEVQDTFLSTILRQQWVKIRSGTETAWGLYYWLSLFSWHSLVIPIRGSLPLWHETNVSSSAPGVTYINTALTGPHLHHSIAANQTANQTSSSWTVLLQMWKWSTSLCREKMINLRCSLCPCLSAELLTNAALMQQCTSDKSAVRCAFCLKLMFEALHDRRGSFPSALTKYTFLCSKLAQPYWDLVQLVFPTVT